MVRPSYNTKEKKRDEKRKENPQSVTTDTQTHTQTDRQTDRQTLTQQKLLLSYRQYTAHLYQHLSPRNHYVKKTFSNPVHNWETKKTPGPSS
jgi:hypothetical protein